MERLSGRWLRLEEEATRGLSIVGLGPNTGTPSAQQ